MAVKISGTFTAPIFKPRFAQIKPHSELFLPRRREREREKGFSEKKAGILSAMVTRFKNFSPKLGPWRSEHFLPGANSWTGWGSGKDCGVNFQFARLIPFSLMASIERTRVRVLAFFLLHRFAVSRGEISPVIISYLRTFLMIITPWLHNTAKRDHMCIWPRIPYTPR